jgi:hypothetical protein
MKPIKPTQSKLVTSSFKGPKEKSTSSKHKGYSPGQYAYSNHGHD